MSKNKILYAEDDETIAFLTQDYLQQYYDVTHCYNGKEAYNLFKEHTFDLCIFDIMMPEMDGFQLAESIRKINSEIPIIFLSAKTLKEDRIMGLKIGADDYLVKPFSIEELFLKIEIFLKRSKKSIQQTNTYQVGSFKFDFENYSLSNGELEFLLTQREAELLKFFIEHKNQVVKREAILKALWGDDDYFLGRSLDVFISRLRKIVCIDEHIQIENLHGIGFRFTVKD
ncbi:DNA-binding response OmpR family regulator [Flavobacterium croceum DSM 17960]|uniref:DNA-binding response OmpR family regulator n=1 Tax=Flavobacterium croceum DSM 17960 TaxID=1121886 RepID=A0A2S4N5D6_9FLAO|nr:response regulator transcription factor [Flavobacterium croceum]POS00870.1 DNA-binding response OmpR family regulator [Flavobacterium croceum DSM 17960]